MHLVDANVLISAVNRQAPHHSTSRQWLEAALNGSRTVLIPWVVLLAFVRLTTSRAALEHPLELHEAAAYVDEWMRHPLVVVPEPAARHLERVVELLAATGVGGNLVNDAHLAALALEHRATVISFDNDFGRFPGVRWEAPKV